MTDFVVFSLGCKVNTYEAQSMINKLESMGFSATDELTIAKYYIINTCSVTTEADKKSRQMISRVKKLNVNAPIYICGCSTQNDPNVYYQKSNVRLVSGVGGKMDFLDKILADIVKTQSEYESDFSLPSLYEDNLSPTLTRSRGIIKIQDGCNNFCSYCIIPFLRGRSRSRNEESIISEAREASKSTNELIFTGINISSYGLDNNNSLIALISKLGKIPVRKRFGSLECHIISEDFVKTMRDSGFCEHLHLSMQSGSDSVLRRMNRHYTKSDFIEKVEIIRKIMPNCGITSDIIVGFSGETELEFNETLETLSRIKFSDAHIFPFSRRKGTVAYNYNQVLQSIKVERVKIITKIKNEHKMEFLTNQIGKELEVYFESRSGNESVGYSSNYVKVYSESINNSIEKITPSKIYKDGLK